MSSTEPAPADDTGARLAAAFTRVHRERMAGLPILHPRLAVAVVGGQDWQGHWLGVLITPWCMNLVLVPAPGSALAAAPAGATRRIDFPAGGFEFALSDLDGVGSFAACSLFSPMQDFADQAAAEDTAAAVLAELLTPTDAACADRSATGQATAAAALDPAPRMSRRDLLRGSFRAR